MKLAELCSFLDSSIPLGFQEDYDNSGLLIGSGEKEIGSALLSIDITEDVMEEAIAAGCDIIISHHPLIFGGLKKITGSNFTERIAARAIKNDIAVYSAHTNLDSVEFGVSRKMAEKLDLQNVKVLMPLKNKLLKLVTFVPESHLESVRSAIFEAGAGKTGNYDCCGFTLPGTGSFRAGENTHPYTGKTGEMNYVKEIRFETVMFSYLKKDVIKALLAAHPYEEVAYDICPLDNENISAGTGCTGELEVPYLEEDFLKHVSEVFSSPYLRFSKLTGKKVRKIALCGGSGGPFINASVASGADVYITADIKYHDFFNAEGKILLVDIGHYESEKFTTEVLYSLIIKKFPKFAVRFSETNTNPINYF